MDEILLSLYRYPGPALLLDSSWRIMKYNVVAEDLLTGNDIYDIPNCITAASMSSVLGNNTNNRQQWLQQLGDWLGNDPEITGSRILSIIQGYDGEKAVEWTYIRLGNNTVESEGSRHAGNPMSYAGFDTPLPNTQNLLSGSDTADAKPDLSFLEYALSLQSSPETNIDVQTQQSEAATYSNPLSRSSETQTHMAVKPIAEGVTILLLGRDATSDRNFYKALSESRGRFKVLVDIACDFAWETDCNGIFTFVSPQGALGYTAKEMVGCDHKIFFLEDFTSLESPFATKVAIKKLELWFKRIDGTRSRVEISALAVFDKEGRWTGARGVARDVSEFQQHVADLAESRTRDQLIEHILQILRNSDTPISGLQGAVTTIAMALAADGCMFYEQDADSRWRISSRFGNLPMMENTAIMSAVESGTPIFSSSGQIQMLTCRTTYQLDTNGVLCLWREFGKFGWQDSDIELVADVSKRLGHSYGELIRQEELRRLSEQDNLTGLYNQRAFIEKVSRLVDEGKATRSAIMFIDLDNFKAVNDTYGHERGDKVLQDVSVVIRKAIRDVDLAARVGGDEFLIWLHNTEIGGAETVAKRLLNSFVTTSESVPLDKKNLSLSAGIAIYTEGNSVAQWIAQADQAMYQAKRGGKATFRSAS